MTSMHSQEFIYFFLQLTSNFKNNIRFKYVFNAHFGSICILMFPQTSFFLQDPAICIIIVFVISVLFDILDLTAAANAFLMCDQIHRSLQVLLLHKDLQCLSKIYITNTLYTIFTGLMQFNCTFQFLSLCKLCCIAFALGIVIIVIF